MMTVWLMPLVMIMVAFWQYGNLQTIIHILLIKYGWILLIPHILGALILQTLTKTGKRKFFVVLGKIIQHVFMNVRVTININWYTKDTPIYQRV